jgi:hypothetical protein
MRAGHVPHGERRQLIQAGSVTFAVPDFATVVIAAADAEIVQAPGLPRFECFRLVERPMRGEATTCATARTGRLTAGQSTAANPCGVETPSSPMTGLRGRVRSDVARPTGTFAPALGRRMVPAPGVRDMTSQRT